MSKFLQANHDVSVTAGGDAGVSALGHAAIGRRDFLKTAAVATGGLVIAVYLPACSKPENAAKNAGPVKQIVANAWLKIGTDGSITVLCDRSEMGQGVYTALPTLVAEELGVAPSSVKVEFADRKSVV